MVRYPNTQSKYHKLFFSKILFHTNCFWSHNRRKMNSYHSYAAYVHVPVNGTVSTALLFYGYEINRICRKQ